MRTPEEEAQLEQTKMSFGEHLEELRRALFRSLAAILVGFLIGLWFGMDIVDYIQEPLRRSLETFYLRQAEAEQLRHLEERKAAGLDVPEDLVAAAHRMVIERLVPHDFFLSPNELKDALAAWHPELGRGLEDALSKDAAADSANVPDELLHLRLYQPLVDDLRMRIVALNVQEGFMIYMKASLAAGIVFASPLVFYFIWEFVAAGLYRSERRYVHMYLPISLGLFLAGVSLAFFVALKPVLDFLFLFYERMHIDPDMRLTEWMSFALIMPLGFGISFQLPLGMLLLERVGIFTVQSYTSKWRISVVVISIISMVFTPADPYSMMIMFIPLTALYFLGILMCKFMPGGPLRSPRSEPGARPEEEAGS
jgi:sec-independent protein translocase protein TatC